MKEFFHKIVAWLSANREDVTVFLLALLLASTTWLIHNLSLKYNEILSVQINASSNIEGRMEKAVSPVSASATCRATGYRFLRFATGNARHIVNVRFAPEDLRYLDGDTYYITSERLKDYGNLLFGSEVTVDHFIKDTVFFRFSKENFRKVPVHVVDRVSFAPQYMSRDGLIVTPDSVLVYGESSRIDCIDEVFTEMISLHNLKADASGNASLERIRGVRFSDKSIGWSIKTERYVEIDKVCKIAVRNVPDDKSLFVYPSTVNAKIRYLFPLVPDIEKTDIFYVDYNDFVSSVNGQCLVRALPLPDGILGYELATDIVECVIK